MKNIFILAFLYLVCAAIISCKEEKISLDQIVAFANPNEQTIPANNIDTIEIVVNINPNADADRRSVQFDTDIGFFTNGTTNFTVIADAEGHAKTSIRSPVAGKAKIKASIQSYSINKSVIFSQVDPQSIIHFESLPTIPVPADNITEQKITIKVDPKFYPDKRAMTLTTNTGTFSNDTPSIQLLAGADGVAETYIKSPDQGRAQLSVTFNGFEAKGELDFTAPDPNTVIKFADDPLNPVDADGQSVVTVKAIINNKVLPGQRTVIFATDLGLFANGTTSQPIEPDETGVAMAYLKSPVEGISHITITHKKNQRQKDFTFLRALPDHMDLKSDFVLKSGIDHTIEISALLSRKIGMPGLGFAVDFSFKDGNNLDIGIFKNQVSSGTDRTAKITFSAGNTIYRGPVTVTASVHEAPSVTATTTIQVTD